MVAGLEAVTLVQSTRLSMSESLPRHERRPPNPFVRAAAPPVESNEGNPTDSMYSGKYGGNPEYRAARIARMQAMSCKK